MSKKIIHFGKAFVPCVVLSVLIIVSGVYALFTKGLNLGIEFKAGLVEDIRIAPTAMELTYTGAANVSVQTSNIGLTVVVSGTGADNNTYEIPYVTYRTVSEVAGELEKIQGVSASVRAGSQESAIGMFASSDASSVLTAAPFRLHYVGENTRDYTIEEVRKALSGVNDVSVFISN